MQVVFASRSVNEMKFDKGVELAKMGIGPKKTHQWKWEY